MLTHWTLPCLSRAIFTTLADGCDAPNEPEAFDENPLKCASFRSVSLSRTMSTPGGKKSSGFELAVIDPPLLSDMEWKKQSEPLVSSAIIGTEIHASIKEGIRLPRISIAHHHPILHESILRLSRQATLHHPHYKKSHLVCWAVD